MPGVTFTLSEFPFEWSRENRSAERPEPSRIDKHQSATADHSRNFRALLALLRCGIKVRSRNSGRTATPLTSFSQPRLFGASGS
jgi:hypothetical protein